MCFLEEDSPHTGSIQVHITYLLKHQRKRVGATMSIYYQHDISIIFFTNLTAFSNQLDPEFPVPSSVHRSASSYPCEGDKLGFCLMLPESSPRGFPFQPFYMCKYKFNQVCFVILKQRKKSLSMSHFFGFSLIVPLTSNLF